MTALPFADVFINGQRSGAPGPDGGDTANSIAVTNPADLSQTVGHCAVATDDDVERAMAAMQGVLENWSSRSAASRAQLLNEAADLIEPQVQELSELLVTEVGKPIHEAKGDVGGAVKLLRLFASLDGYIDETEDLTGQAGTGAADEVLLQRVAAGPAAVIVPWNSPVYLCFNAVAPALIAGCPVVVKPPEIAPLALCKTLEILAEALPPGVLNILPGPGSSVGEAITRHPAIRAISFTGGTVAGRKVLAAASETIKKVALELGGNDPAIVLSDADLSEQYCRELMAGSFSLAGQVCFNIKRIYVHESRFDELFSKLCTLTDQLVMGSGLNHDVTLGPVTTEPGYNNAQRLLTRAAEQGYTVHTGGVWAENRELTNGYFIRPTLVAGLPYDDPLVLEEQFAPIMPILTFTDEDEVIAEANRTEFGLCSSVWTTSAERGLAVAQRIQAGNTFINAHRIGASVPLVPFGGVKQSGLGRNHMQHAIDEFVEEHAIIRYSEPWNQVPGITAWEKLSL